MKQFWLGMSIIVGLFSTASFVGVTHAKSIAVNTQQAGVTILLTDESCDLRDKVGNLPNRATWKENGVTHEGCWGLYGQTVMAFFADLTVVAIPAHTFREAVNI
jgi:hypothetical protein